MPALIFAGTPEFAAQALAALLAAGHRVPLVLTQPDRPAGRGMKLQASPVKQLALQHGLPVAQPQGLRLDGRHAADAQLAQQQIRQALADGAQLMVVAAYGLILPRWVLQAPPRGCLNIHASLLPRWRGAAPIHRAIEAGDARTGITLMQMDEGLDTGAMLLRAEAPIHADDTTASLHDRLATLGGQLCVQGLAQLDALQAAAQAQPAEGVCYAHKIDKAEAAIDWTQPAAAIERRVRAFDPFPGAHFVLDGAAVKLWRARCVAGQPDAVPGQVLDAHHAHHLGHYHGPPHGHTGDGPADGGATGTEGATGNPGPAVRVACGDGQALALLQLQRPGGRRIDAAAWLQHQPDLLGRVLG